MNGRRAFLTGLLALLTLLLIGFGPGAVIHSQPSVPPPALPNGVAAGDVSATSAVLWTRAAATETLTFQLAATTEASRRVQPAEVRVADALRPLGVAFDDLTPSTTYHYTVTTSSGQSQSGQFRTPALDGHHGLRFGASGDGRGDWLPFQALANAPARDLDFFVYLGDTVYADIYSPALPDRVAVTLNDYRRKHAEVLSTQHGRNYLADLRRATAFYASIDDHEIVDDFAGGAPAATDSRFPETSGRINDTVRYESAMQAFQEYYPLLWERYGREGGDGRMDDEVRLYRYREFGDDAALFILDARSFRDDQLAEPNLADPADILRFLNESHDSQRTLLGQAQIAALQRDLLVAKAQGITWKFIALPVPIQNLGAAGASDRYEGYAAERSVLLAFIREHDIRNVVFIAADVHGTLVNNLVYRPGFDLAAPQVQTGAWEITVGSSAAAGMLGPTIVAKGEQLGLLSAADVAFYDELPVAPDMDSRIDDKDDFVRAMLNQIVDLFGYPTIGLDNGRVNGQINARLREGDYLSTHTFGWTEFEVDASTQKLTVTTYGIEAYDAGVLATDPAAVIERMPQVVSRFTVRPHAEVSGIFLPIVRH